MLISLMMIYALAYPWGYCGVGTEHEPGCEQYRIKPKFPAYRCVIEYPKAIHCDKDSSFCLSDSFDTDDLPRICRPVEE